MRRPFSIPRARLPAATLAALLWLGAATPAGAADPAPVAEPAAARAVDFGPDPPLPADRLEQVTGIHPGGAVSPQALAGAIRALVALPQVRWAEVRTEPAGAGEVAVFFRLVRTLHMARLEVEGARRLGADPVERAARMNPGDEVDEERLVQVRDRVQRAYADKGYFEARVKTETASAGPRALADQVVVRVVVDEGRRAVVAEVRYTGLPPEAGSGPWRRRVHKGFAFDAENVRRDLAGMERYLIDKGYLNPQVGPYALDVEGRRVTITVPVRVHERVRLTVSGGGPLSHREARRILNLTGQRTLDEAVRGEAEARLEAALKAQGYRDARVSLDVRREPDAVLEVHARVEAGPRHRVEAVRFEGSMTYPASELEDLVKPGFHLLPEPVREGVIDERAALVEGALRAAGFADAAVTDTIAPVPGGRARDTVTYHVDEGRRWWVETVEVTGTDGLDPQARKQAERPALALVGAPYRRDRVRAARADVAGVLATFGYVDAEVEAESTTRDVWRGKVGPGGVPLREVMVAFTFRVGPGPQVRVGRVRVDGSYRTRPYIVHRELAVREGDLFTPQALADTRRRLFRAAAFERVQVGPADPDDHSATRDVDVHLVEGKPGAVEVGAGYGEKDGIRGLLDLSYRDLFRRGQQGGVRFRYGQLRRSVTLSHVLPWIGPYRLALHTRAIYEREDLLSYEHITWAVESGIRRPVFDDVVLTLTYRLERNRFPRLPADQVPVVAERRRISVGSLFGSLVRDTRDDPFSPTRGTVVGATYEQGAHILASQVQFAKATLQAAGFLPVGRDVVLAGKVQTGRVQRLFSSTEVPISERFFMGGQSSVRGYALDSLGVPGETLVGGLPQGGLIMVLSNLELRLGGRKGWGLVLFADAGNVWRYAGSIGLNDFRAGAGPGLEYATPVGPLRLDLGYKIDRRPGESVYRIHFTLGHTF